MDRNYEYWESDATGDCLGDEWHNTTVTVNPNLSPRSGDVVCVWVVDQETGKARSMLKILEATRDGRWWLQCLEGTVPICGYFVPAEIRPVVTRRERRGPTRWQDQSWRSGDVAEKRRVIGLWDGLSLDARAEWSAHGKVRGKAFPGIAEALAVGAPASDWPESFRLAADYFRPRAEAAP